MAINNIESKHRGDGFKWFLILVLLAGSIFANYHYSTVVLAIRASIGLVVVCALMGIAVTTAKGATAWEFIKAARNELRKVVWPTRQETTQTTLMVIVMVLIMAVVLWGVDSFYMWLLSLLANS
jgi:preprotein translocase subunit SecE